MQQILINKKSKKIKLIFNSQTKKIEVNGPLGKINYNFNFEIVNGKIFLEETKFNFFVTKIKKLLKSVTTGWFLELNLNGLGFKSFKLNDKIALDLGYSNLIIYKPTNSIKIKNFKNKIILFSLDQEYLYNVGFTIKNYSSPDPYKGKGILRKNEIVKLKKKARS